MAMITKSQIESLVADNGDAFLWDEALKGFGVKASTGGRKTFVLQYRFANRSRRMTIGATSAITPEQARSVAQSAMRQLARGEDPLAERDQKRSEKTTGELLSEFLAHHVKVHLKPSTIIEYERLVEKQVPASFKRIPVTQVLRADLSALHRKHRHTPFQANRMLAVLRKFFNWCEQQGYRPDHSNPATHVTKYKEEARSRFLSSVEIARLGEVLSDPETAKAYGPYVVAALRLLLLTGARRGEILGLAWDWIDWDGGCIHLPDSKTGKKRVMLSPPALQVLATLPRFEGNPYVIAGFKKGARLVNLQKPWNAIRKRAGLEGVRIHDLRHSFASMAVASGMSLPMIGALLGHSQPSTTQRYAHLADDPLRDAAAMVGARMDILPKVRSVQQATG